MEIKKINHIVRCDMAMCRNEAKLSIGQRNAMLKRKLNLCEKCANELYSELGKIFTPKSPKNIVSKKKAIRSKQ